MGSVIKKENQQQQTTLHLRKTIIGLKETINNLENKNKCLCGIIENHIIYEEHLEDEFFNLGDAIMGLKQEEA